MCFSKAFGKTTHSFTQVSRSRDGAVCQVPLLLLALAAILTDTHTRHETGTTRPLNGTIAGGGP